MTEMEEERTSAVQALLIKAWRERWADFQWSTKLKQYVAPGSLAESNQIADMLLTQTFVGPSPSGLILSYLKHAIMSEVVSLTGVLSAMVKYSDAAVTRPYCMRSLLDIFMACMIKFGIRSTAEESLQLSVALLEVVHWLLVSITRSLEQLQTDTRDIVTIHRNTEIISEILRKVCSRDNLKLLLYVGRLEDEGECLAKLEVAGAEPEAGGVAAGAGGATPGGVTPGGVTPGGVTPGGVTPGGPVPGGPSPGGTTPGGTTPGPGTEPEKEQPKPISLWTRVEKAMTDLTTLLNNIPSPQQPMGNQRLSQLETILNSVRTSQHSAKKDGKAETLKARLENNLAEISRIPMQTLHTRSANRCENTLALKALSCSVNVMTFMEAAFNLTSDIQLFVDQLLLMEKLQNLPRSALYRELFHASFLGLVEDLDPTEEIKWVAFTFLKLPQIIQRLQQCVREDLTAGDSLVEGLYSLIKFNVLLDLVDTKLRCDVVKQLLVQLAQCSVLTEGQVKDISSARATSTKVTRPTEAQQPVSLVVLVTKAESLVNSIKSEVRNQDDMLGLLGHMKAGKSFDYMVAAAAARNKLRKFSAKLIKINEFAKQSTGEGGKASQVRAVTFDLTFLMLCRIAQLYGTEMVLSSTGDSFFETWVHQCMPDDTGTKPLSGMPAADPSKIDMLLNQYHTGMEFKIMQVRWSEVCLAIPYAIQQLLHAWEYGAVSEEHVSKLVDSLKGRVCCLPVCCVAWLCSHMTSLSSPERGKAHRLLQMMMTSVPNSATSLQMYDNERNSLMTTVVKKMSTSVLGNDAVMSAVETPSWPSPTTPLAPEPNSPSLETLSTTFRTIVKRGVVDRKSLTAMDALLTSGGALWFCRSIVMELTSLHRKDELTTAVEVAVALFQVDIEQMTLTLLRRVIPRLLADMTNMDRLANPRGNALARLVVWCIAATLTSQNSFRDSKSKESPSRIMRGRKRGRGEMEREESSGLREDSRPSKLRKLLSTADEEPTAPPLTGSVGAASSSSSFLVMQTQQPYAEPLHFALVSVMQLFASVVASGFINPRTEFVHSFIQEVLYCGETISTNVLQFMPVTMATHLLNTSSGIFMQDLALAIGQLEGPTPRKMAAKALCQTKRL